MRVPAYRSSPGLKEPDQSTLRKDTMEETCLRQKNAWNTLKNMGLIAVRDPIGALISVIISPFRLGPRFVKLALGYVVILAFT